MFLQSIDQETGQRDGAGLVGLGRRIDHRPVHRGHAAVHPDPAVYQVDVGDGQCGRLVVFHLVLARAVTDSRLSVNPAAELELPRLDEIEKRYLTAGQIRGLAAAAGEHGALVLLLGFTGLRFGQSSVDRQADALGSRALGVSPEPKKCIT